MCVCIYHVQITEYSLNSHLSFKHICMYMFWMHVLSCFSHIWVSVSLWTVAHQAPLFRGILQASILEWAVVPSSRGSSRPRIDPCFLCLLHWQAGSSPLLPPESMNNKNYRFREEPNFNFGWYKKGNSGEGGSEELYWR